MTEPSNINLTSPYSQPNPTNSIEKGGPLLRMMTSTGQETPSLFRHYEKNIVLFAYNRQIDEDPPNQIMVLQQSKKRHHRAAEVDKISEMFGNFNLEGTTQKLFLTKVDPLEHKEIAKQIKQMMEVADNFSRKDRSERRKQMFQSTRAQKIAHQYASEDVIAKRKIRVVKMDSLIQGGSIKGVVELGGKSIEYEDLNIMSQNQDYYTLVRKTVRVDEIFPQISIEQNLLSKIEFEDEGMEEENNRNDDDYDSNDSNNSAFDYPEEEQSQRSSQEIIRDYDQDEYNYSDEDKEDEEEIYRKYLRRQRRKQQKMDEEQEQYYEEYD